MMTAVDDSFTAPGKVYPLWFRAFPTYRALAHPIATPELSKRHILADVSSDQTV
jgi:hypothetical protein